ncbi:glycosyltransferase family 2 protein [Ferruginibacter sp. SUN002]|uniref:glycosyltransferase family 2 protein n=1 Tax=Ferruginibacter sp. SUN002 TaxID=2937789 RepID=UPI003D36E0FB
MKVSIITVTFNSSRFLEDCIKSVIMQDYDNIEHIVVDGKSTDGTVAIIEKYNNNIAKWVSERDFGMYDAINKGMAMATGDIIGILNSDDILASTDVMSSIVNAFQQNNVESIFGDLAYVEQMDTQKIHRFWKGDVYKRSRFKFGWMPAHPTFYVKRSVVEKFGGYESHFYTAADYEFMARYLFKNHVSAHYLPKLLVRMRIGGMSNNNLKSRFRANRRDYLAMKKNKIPLPFIVSILKPLRKLPQYFKKYS